MKRYLYPVLLIFAAFIFQCQAQGASPVKVRALKDNTNLRAKPALNVEVVGQVSAGQELIARSIDVEWIEVAAPTNIDFWVLGDYLKDGVVVCRQAVNVRAGPGINFSIVGQLANGSKVDGRGNLKEWIKIAPPDGCSLWVSRPLVEIVPAVKIVPDRPAVSEAPIVRSPVLKPAAESAPAPREEKTVEIREPVKTAPEAGSETKSPAVIKPPADLDLIPEIGQGQYKQYEGVLRTKNFLVRSPSNFRLVAEDESGQPRTICYVKGNRSQLEALVFRRLVVYGRQYWVHRVRQPVIVPEKITIK